jgi:hypothetical protein
VILLHRSHDHWRSTGKKDESHAINVTQAGDVH